MHVEAIGGNTFGSDAAAGKAEARVYGAAQGTLDVTATALRKEV